MVCVLPFCSDVPHSFTGAHHSSFSEDLGGAFNLPLRSGGLACLVRMRDTHQHIHVAFSVLQVGNPRVELTLSELQDMAARQQQQIENQQQMLVAKVIIIYRPIFSNICKRKFHG